MEMCYKRVSSTEQNIDRQLHGITFDKRYEYIEMVSGKDKERPRLQAMLANIREGDIIHVHEMSRLARNTKDLLDIVQEIIEYGGTIKFHKENLEFKAGKDNALQNLMLSMLSAISQFERDLLLERQREGISLAKQRGVYKGKQSKFTKSDINLMKRQFAESGNKAALVQSI